MKYPIPKFFNPAQADQIYMIPYEQRFEEALKYRTQNQVTSSARDAVRIGLLIIDAQNTFCLPTGQLYVGGQSGRGAVDDTIRLTQFIYGNLGKLTNIYCTMDTHEIMQIFHRLFWVDSQNNHPGPATTITVDDVLNGKWSVNPAMAGNILGSPSQHVGLQKFAQHYVESLAAKGRYNLMVWPHHAMLGGADHALVSMLHEATFFHSVVRQSRTRIEVKGGNPLTENYSVLGAEVLETSEGMAIAQRNVEFIRMLLDNDYLIIAGQAKSHCVAWTIYDLLNDIKVKDPKLAEKVYLLSDCTSPVVIPGVYDFTPDADKAFAEFEAAGMHLVKSTDAIDSWKGLKL